MLGAVAPKNPGKHEPHCLPSLLSRWTSAQVEPGAHPESVAFVQTVEKHSGKGEHSVSQKRCPLDLTRLTRSPEGQDELEHEQSVKSTKPEQ